MKAELRFNVRSAGWLDQQRPAIMSSHPDGIGIAFGASIESGDPRSLRMVMSAPEALDLAERLIRAVRERDGADSAVALEDTGRMLLLSQYAFVGAQQKACSHAVTKRMLTQELSRIERELADGYYQSGPA